MCIPQGAGDGQQQAQRLFWAVSLTAFVLERTTLDELHYQVGNPALLTVTVDWDDVGVVQLGDSLSLAAETLGEVGIAGEELRQHLDRHVAVEGSFVTFVNRCHASLT